MFDDEGVTAISTGYELCLGDVSYIWEDLTYLDLMIALHSTGDEQQLDCSTQYIGKSLHDH